MLTLTTIIETTTTTTIKLQCYMTVYTLYCCVCVCNKFHKMLYKLLHCKVEEEIEIEEEEYDDVDDDDCCL